VIFSRKRTKRIAWQYKSATGEARKSVAREWRAAVTVTALGAVGGTPLSRELYWPADKCCRGQDDLSTLRTHIPHQRINTKHAPSAPRNRLITILPSPLRSSIWRFNTRYQEPKYYYHKAIHTYKHTYIPSCQTYVVCIIIISPEFATISVPRTNPWPTIIHNIISQTFP
jgi:hypothetical protein